MRKPNFSDALVREKNSTMASGTGDDEDRGMERENP